MDVVVADDFDFADAFADTRYDDPVEVQQHPYSFEADQRQYPYCKAYSYARCLARFIILRSRSELLHTSHYQELFGCILGRLVCDGINDTRISDLISRINKKEPYIFDNDNCNIMVNNFNHLVGLHTIHQHVYTLEHGSNVHIKYDVNTATHILSKALEGGNYASISIYYYTVSDFNSLKTKKGFTYHISDTDNNQMREGNNTVKHQIARKISGHEIVVTKLVGDIITLKNSWGRKEHEEYNINDLFITCISYFSMIDSHKSYAFGVKKKKKRTKKVKKNKKKSRNKNNK